MVDSSSLSHPEIGDPPILTTCVYFRLLDGAETPGLLLLRRGGLEPIGGVAVPGF